MKKKLLDKAPEIVAALNGECSERRSPMSKKLEPCPICHAEAKVGYACGDYFMYCSEGCPSLMCDHPSESTTICSWNDWAKWYRNRRAATEANEPLTLEELEALEDEWVWVVMEDYPEPVPMKIDAGRRMAAQPGCVDDCLFDYYGPGTNDYYGWRAYRRLPEEGNQPAQEEE